MSQDQSRDAWLRGYRGRRVLITGGLGFIGSNVAHRLIELGSQVTIVDALIPELGGNLYNVQDIADDIRVEIADLCSDAVAKHLVHDQEIIFNLAGQVAHVDSMDKPYRDLNLNLHSHVNLLEACRHFNPEAKVVYTGTRGQYGRAQYLPVDEKHPQRPIDVNGVNKVAAEQYHFVYYHAYGLRTCSLRLTNTYGPRQPMKHDRHGFIAWFVRKAMDGETILVFGDGSQLRDFNYVDDVVSALLLAGASPACDGQAFNLGGGQPISVLRVAELVIEAAGRGQIQKVPFPEKRRRIEIGDYYADYSKFKAATGWEPTVSMKEGLRRTVDFFAKAREHYWERAS